MALSKLAEFFTPKKKRIYDFSDGKFPTVVLWWALIKRVCCLWICSGCAEDRQFLGYKGAILAEMSRIKVPVPYGFVVSAECSTEFLAHHPGDQELHFRLVDGAGAGSSKDNQAGDAAIGTVAVEQSGLFSKPFKAELTRYVHQLERSTGRIFSGEHIW